jgi:DNA-binding CsgD family transcriptional regulator
MSAQPEHIQLQEHVTPDQPDDILPPHLRLVEDAEDTAKEISPEEQTWVEYKLTERQFYLLGQMAIGKTSKEIALQGGGTREGVDSVVESSYEKLGVKNKTEAAIWAQENILGEDLTDLKDLMSLDLTTAELDVLGLTTLGFSRSKAAERLGITEETIASHLTSIYENLGVSNRIQAANLAKEVNLLHVAFTLKTNIKTVSGKKVLEETKKAIEEQMLELKDSGFAIRGLTDTEREIFKLAMKDIPRQELAKLSQKSDRTVRFHLNNIYKKIGVTNRAEATGRIIFLKFINEQRALSRTKATIPNNLEDKAYTTEVSDPLQGLTRRQMEVLSLITLGSSNAEIADQLYITKETVKFHLTGIYRNLGVKNRTQASNLARESGVLQPIVEAGTIDGIPIFLKSRIDVGSKDIGNEEARSKVSKLTPTELRVLSFLSEGLTNPEIGEKLGISRETVKFHVSNILEKLDTKTRTETADLAYFAFMGAEKSLPETENLHEKVQEAA